MMTSGPIQMPTSIGPALPPKPSFDVVLELSDGDRWYAAQMLNELPWGGMEETITIMSNIHTKLRLEEINLGTMPAMQAKAVEKFTLPSKEAEALIKIVCGGGGMKSVPGTIGPGLGKLVLRIRKSIADSAPAAAAAPSPAVPIAAPAAAPEAATATEPTPELTPEKVEAAPLAEAAKIFVRQEKPTSDAVPEPVETRG